MSLFCYSSSIEAAKLAMAVSQFKVIFSAVFIGPQFSSPDRQIQQIIIESSSTTVNSDNDLPHTVYLPLCKCQASGSWYSTVQEGVLIID